jgi:ABC-2 type transport system permease protein
MNNQLWLIRREFWENRAIWMIPAVFGGLLIIAALFGHVEIPNVGSRPDEAKDAGGIFLIICGGMFYAVMAVYATWYVLDCLYTDRKDRSILFWKSLPLSDTETVVSKLIVGMLVIPVVYFIAADVTSLIVAFILSIRVRAALGGALWQPDMWLQIQVLWGYAIVTTAIWYLPITGWLLVVSAWAKRAVMLWSILPPLALCIIERFMGTTVVWHIIRDRLFGWPAVAVQGSMHRWAGSDVHSADIPRSVWHLIDAGAFFSNPQTWIGAAVGVALIVAAIQLRMRRSET